MTVGCPHIIVLHSTRAHLGLCWEMEIHTLRGCLASALCAPSRCSSGSSSALSFSDTIFYAQLLAREYVRLFHVSSV